MMEIRRSGTPQSQVHSTVGKRFARSRGGALSSLGMRQPHVPGLDCTGLSQDDLKRAADIGAAPILQDAEVIRARWLSNISNR